CASSAAPSHTARSPKSTSSPTAPNSATYGSPSPPGPLSPASEPRQRPSDCVQHAGIAMRLVLVQARSASAGSHGNLSSSGTIAPPASAARALHRLCGISHAAWGGLPRWGGLPFVVLVPLCTLEIEAAGGRPR